MPLEFETSPERQRAALIRHIARGLGICDQLLADRTSCLTLEDLVACLNIDPGSTEAALAARQAERAAEAEKQAAQSEPRGEDRIATHDGWRWPVERALMKSPGAIIARMAGDIAAIVDEKDFCDIDDLTARGWTEKTVRTHGRQAVLAFEANRRKEAA